MHRRGNYVLLLQLGVLREGKKKEVLHFFCTVRSDALYPNLMHLQYRTLRLYGIAITTCSETESCSMGWLISVTV